MPYHSMSLGDYLCGRGGSHGGGSSQRFVVITWIPDDMTTIRMTRTAVITVVIMNLIPMMS